MSRLGEVVITYNGSDADRTRRLYAELEGLGPVGTIAVNLFRAQKASERAKAYRGRSYKGAAYDKKQWSLNNLCDALHEHGSGWRWGWGIDPLQPVHDKVLYVDLPTGQVSFHSQWRSRGGDYPGQWDGCRDASADRIVRWVAQLLDGPAAPLTDLSLGVRFG